MGSNLLDNIFCTPLDKYRCYNKIQYKHGINEDKSSTYKFSYIPLKYLHHLLNGETFLAYIYPIPTSKYYLEKEMIFKTNMIDVIHIIKMPQEIYNRFFDDYPDQINRIPSKYITKDMITKYSNRKYY